MSDEVRVLRVLEYTYSDTECMIRDMANWQIPATGIKSHGHVIIRSSTMPLSVVNKVPEPEEAVDICVTGEECAGSVAGRPKCSAEIADENGLESMGFHCYHWYEDLGCCYCDTDTVNLKVFDADDDDLDECVCVGPSHYSTCRFWTLPT